MRHSLTAFLLALAGISALLTGFVLHTRGPITRLPNAASVRAPPESKPETGDLVTRSPGRTDEAGASTEGPVMPPAAPTRLRIPAIEVDARLVDVGLRKDATLEVPSDGALAGWYAQGPAPGTVGPAVIVGHIDWNGEAGVFARLGALRPGDRVVVDRADGTSGVFEVGRLEQHPKNRFPAREVYGATDHAALRLITCGGEFDSARRSYRDNIIAYARLVRAQ